MMGGPNRIDDPPKASSARTARAEKKNLRGGHSRSSTAQSKVQHILHLSLGFANG